MTFRGIIGSMLAALCIVTCSAAMAAPSPFPDFWPSGHPLERGGYDFWRVWQTRCAVSESPTSAYDLLDRNAVMNMWIGQLQRSGLPVDDVAPRTRVAKVSQLIGSRDITAACREIDAIYRGLEGMVASKEAVRGRGAIVGMVIDEAGSPVPLANVMLFGSPLGAISDENGKFLIEHVPCTTPRYIVTATKQGYIDGFAGDIGPEPDMAGEAVIMVEKIAPENAYRKGSLAVQVCRLIDIKDSVNVAAPLETAVIDMKLYAKEVLPYLKPSSTIDSDSTAVRALAENIMASVPEADRLRSTILARAVYQWIVRNVECDLMRNFPDDPTGGDWQTSFGGWGRNFDDWAYLPSEVIKHKRAIGIEFERLAAALLRALNIPARPAPLGADPVCQWWVQLPTGNGYWANMETSRGRTEFARTGRTDAAFPAVGDDEIAFYSVDERAPIHMMWDAARPCMWLENYGQRARVGHSPAALELARRWLTSFTENGRLPRATNRQMPRVPVRSLASYNLATRGVVVNLASLGAQKNLTFRFPLFIGNQYRMTVDMQHWTNHPEWVTTVRREKEQNEFTRETMEWYVIEFELGKQAPKPAEPEAAPAG